MDRIFTQIVIRPGVFGLVAAAAIGYVIGQTTVYVKAVKIMINDKKDEDE